MADVGEVEGGEQLRRTGPGRPPWKMAELRHHLEVLLPAEQIVDCGELAGEADRTLHAHRVGDQVVTGDHRGTGVRPHQGGQDPHHGRLACPIGTEQGEHRSRRDGRGRPGRARGWPPKDFVIPEATTVYSIRKMVYEAHSYSQGDDLHAGPDAENQPPPTLPPGLDLLWGRREPGRRGPKPGLTVDGIVAAAVRLADAEGLEAVSMARVAKELGFTTMSLYRYVTSKEELLQLMWNASAQGAEDLELDGANWRERLQEWAMVQREMLDRHPWITQMPMAAPPLAPNSLTFVERGLEALDDTGISEADRLRVIGLISSYTLSEARMAHDAARADAKSQVRQPTTTARSPRWTFEALLRELVDEQQLPDDFTGLPGLRRSGTIRPASMSDRNFSSDSTGFSTVFRRLSTKPELTSGRLTFNYCCNGPEILALCATRVTMRCDGLIIACVSRL